MLERVVVAFFSFFFEVCGCCVGGEDSGFLTAVVVVGREVGVEELGSRGGGGWCIYTCGILGCERGVHLS